MDTSMNIDQILAEIGARLMGTESDLGFGGHNARYRTRVYVNDQDDYFWYTWNPNEGERGKANPIYEHSLKGSIVNIRYYVKQSADHGDSVKLLVDVDADEQYTLEAGYNTAFARSLLASISSADPAQLQGPVVIEVRRGDTGKVLMANLYTDEGLVLCQSYRETETDELYFASRDVLGLPDEDAQADESEFQTEEAETQEHVEPSAPPPSAKVAAGPSSKAKASPSPQQLNRPTPPTTRTRRPARGILPGR